MLTFQYVGAAQGLAQVALLSGANLQCCVDKPPESEVPFKKFSKLKSKQSHVQQFCVHTNLSSLCPKKRGKGELFGLLSLMTFAVNFTTQFNLSPFSLELQDM